MSNTIDDTPLTISDLPGSIPRKKVHKFLPAIPFQATITGKSGSGKTLMIANLIKHYRDKGHFKKGYVFCFTHSHSGILKKLGVKLFFDLTGVTDDGDEIDIIESIMESQEAIGRKAPHVLILADDLITSSELNKRRGIFSKLFAMGRHFNISVILTSQQHTLIPASLRRLAHDTFCFKVTNQKERDAVLYELQRGLSNKQVEKLFDYATKDKYSFLHVDNEKDKYYLRLEKEIDPSDFA